MEKPQIVLVIDDDYDVAKILEHILSARGYDVAHAGETDNGINLFDHHKEEISHILVDGEMPGSVTTVDLVAYFIGQGFTGNIIAISGKKEMNELLLAAGCKKALPKPFTLAELGDAMDHFSGSSLAPSGI